MKIEDLINRIKKYAPNADFNLINKAYNFASMAHFNQMRESGHEHMYHLLGASKILADLKLDEVTIAACLLHDVLEDTNISENALRTEFGDEVTNIVLGVTKINKIRIPDHFERQAESLRKMLIASTRDMRIILIKIADRLDNMRSLQYFREDKIKRISKETLDIYAPIAYRLGLANIKWQLEDLAFRYLEPKIYNDLREKVSKKRHEREIKINKIRATLEKELRKNNINAEITGRVKNFYSIYKKITERNYDFDKMYDLIGLRIIVDEVKECYEALGVVHNLFKPVMDRFKDYIANPKPNMYRSLHTIVIFDDEPVEIQIRTKEMDKISEEGVAAHWQYKKLKGDVNFEKKLGIIKDILRIKDDSSKEFLETLKVDLFGESIFVFTPKSDIIQVPKDATIVDFAYAVHTDLGNKCIGGKVNGKFVNIKYNLKNSDVVEVLTSKNQKPNRGWLKFVRSPKARSKIMHYLKIREEIPVGNLRKIEISKKSIVDCDLKTNFIKLADCCNPLPKDDIIGLSTKNNKVTVHKKDCESAKDKKLKKVNVFWNNDFGLVVNIRVIAHDRVGLFADVLNNISSLNIAIEKADAKTLNKDLAECNIRIKMGSLDDVMKIIKNIKNLADIKKISLS